MATAVFPAPVMRKVGRLLVLLGLTMATAGTAVAFDPRLYDDFTLAKQCVLLVSAGVILVGLACSAQRPRLSPVVITLLAAWILWLTFTLLAGRDPLGSVLGLYQYRQGYATQLVYVLLFLGGSTLTRTQFRIVGYASLAALVITAVYAGLQSFGRDPLSWWIDTSDRPIGTVGNANELGGFALISLGWLGVMAGANERRRVFFTVAVIGVTSFVAFDAESKSALLGLVTFALLYAALRQRVRGHTAHGGLVLAAGFALGAVLAQSTGGLPGLAGRFDVAATDPSSTDAGGSTRLELWRGTLKTVFADPVTGAGPDGLHLAFPEHKRANAGGDFADYDLVAQSSHNWPLDVAANAGLPGLLLFGSVLGATVVFAARRTDPRGDDGRVSILAASGGYILMTLLNPISLSAHAVFFVLLGYAGQTRAGPPETAPSRLFHSAGIALASTVAALLLAGSIALHRADMHAARAWDEFAAWNFKASALEYQRAAEIMPVERHYRGRASSAWLAALTADPPGNPETAISSLEDVEASFPLTPAQMGEMAIALYAAGRPANQIDLWLLRMARADPHGITTQSVTEELQAALESPAHLVFDEEKGTVRVEALGAEDIAESSPSP